MVAQERPAPATPNNGTQAPAHLNFKDLELFGREEELAELQKAYKRVLTKKGAKKKIGDELVLDEAAELVLVKGQSGTGKSALVNVLKEQAERENTCYFVSGKFEQICESRPYAAVVSALTELCDALVASEDLEKVRAQLKKSLSTDDPAMLVNVVPEFRAVYGCDCDYDMELTCRKEFGFERLKLAVKAFVQSVCCTSRPVAMFIDGAQWSDGGSLELLESMATGVEDAERLFIFAYRDDEMEDSHPLAVKLQEIIKPDCNINVTDIYVKNLDVDTLNELIARVTGASETQSLTDVVYRKTGGNPFFAIQFLRLLRDKGLLYHNMLTFKCEWDIEKILRKTSISDNVVELMASKIDGLSPLCKASLKIAACLGTHFDLKLVTMIVEARSEKCKETIPDGIVNEGTVAEALDGAAEEGLIETRPGSSMYRFSHDRIKQAAYLLLQDGTDREAIHLRIGRMLLRLRRSEGQWHDWMLLVAADQLNLGSPLMERQSEKTALAELNLEAAEFIMKKSAFFPACAYLRAGIDLMPEKSKWDEHYDLMIELCSSLAEMEYCCGHFGTCRQLVQEVLAHARSLPEKFRVYFVLMQAEAADGDIKDSVDIGLKALRQLNERYPKRPVRLRLVIDVMRMRRLLRGFSDTDLLELPTMTDQQKLLTIKAVNFLAVHVFETGRTDILASLTMRQLQISVQHGITRTCSFVFAMYGVVAGVLGDIDEAYRFGKLSLQLEEQKGAYYEDPRTPCAVYTCLHHLKHPLQEGIEPLLRGYNLSMETGDLLFAGMNLAAYCAVYLYCGLPLAPFNDDMKAFGAQMVRYRQIMNLSILNSYRQYALNLMGEADDPLVLTGETMNQTEMIQKASNMFLLRNIWLLRVMLGYYFRDLDTAGEMADHIWSDASTNRGTHCNVIIFLFFGGLISFERLRKKKAQRRKHKMRARKAIEMLEKLVKTEAVNCHHMLLLLRAEEALYEGKDTDFIKAAYDKAITSASRSGFVHHAALANERAGLFFIERNDQEWAEFYLGRSHTLYFEWGAMAKVAQLEHLHAFLATRRKSQIASKASHFLRGRARFDPQSEERHEGKSIVAHLSDEATTSESSSARVPSSRMTF